MYIARQHLRNQPWPAQLSKTLCPSGLRGWTQVPLARAAWVQIPQVSIYMLVISWKPRNVYVFLFGFAAAHAQSTRKKTIQYLIRRTWYIYGSIHVFLWTNDRISERIIPCSSGERGICPGGSNQYLQKGRGAISLVRRNICTIICFHI